MPAPSPPGLKSSIEYFAMSVGIGRTLMVPRLGKSVSSEEVKGSKCLIRGVTVNAKHHIALIEPKAANSERTCLGARRGRLIGTKSADRYAPIDWLLFRAIQAAC